MSYISIKDANGNDVEIKTAEDLLSLNEGRLGIIKYRDAMLEKIRENKAQNKAPFDDIDFPDCTQKNFGWNYGLFIEDDEGNSSEFQKAMTQQIEKYDSSKLEKFVLAQDIPPAWPTGMEKGLLQAFSSDQQEKSLDAVIAASRYVYENPKERYMPLEWFGPDYIKERMKRGDTLSKKSVQHLSVLLESTNRNHQLSDSTIRALAPALMKADMSGLDDKAKQKIEDLILQKTGMDKTTYLSKSNACNLSLQSFLEKPNLTFEDAKEYTKNFNTSVYDLLKKAPKENESAASVRGQLVVEEIAEKGFDAYHYKDEDVIRGYKDNLQALKAFGANIDSGLINVVAKEETFKNNPDFKFLIEAEHLADGNISSAESSLKEIAEKGLNAGYGADFITSKVGAYLDARRDGIEEVKKEHEECLKKEAKAQEIKNTYETLSAMRDSLDAVCAGDFKKYVSSDEILRLALEKRAGKDVKPFVCEDTPTKGIKGLFMKKSAKEAEAQDIAHKKQAYEAANKFIETFAQKYKNEPLAENIDSYETLRKSVNEAYAMRDSREGQYKYYAKQANEERIAFFEKINGLYLAAQGKIQEQMHAEVGLRQTARETSGVKNAQNGVGIDILALKEKIRKNAPEGKDMSVKSLYETVSQMRGLGKAAPNTTTDKDASQSTVDLKRIKENAQAR